VRFVVLRPKKALGQNFLVDDIALRIEDLHDNSWQKVAAVISDPASNPKF
jgi:hypothetical protein